ncbi:hypothetical protein T06_2173, partial [Trichinella sp. T6]
LCSRVIVVPDRSSCDLLRRMLIPRCNKRSKRLSGVCFVTQSLQIVWSLLSSTWRAPPPAIERTPETFASCILEGKWAAVRSTQTVTSRKRRIKRRLSRRTLAGRLVWRSEATPTGELGGQEKPDWLGGQQPDERGIDEELDLSRYEWFCYLGESFYKPTVWHLEGFIFSPAPCSRENTSSNFSRCSAASLLKTIMSSKYTIQVVQCSPQRTVSIRRWNVAKPNGDGPTGAQLYSHSGPLFIYWSLSSLFY